VLVDHRYIATLQEELQRTFNLDPTDPDLTFKEIQLVRSAAFMYLMGPHIWPFEP